MEYNSAPVGKQLAVLVSGVPIWSKNWRTLYMLDHYDIELHSYVLES